MSHFPGFKDRAQFDNAYDEILNQVTSRISPDLTYTSAFKGWATGELSVALTSLGTSSSTSAGGAVIVALKDRTAGEAWVSSEIARTGMTFTSQDYAGTKLYSATQATGGSDRRVRLHGQGPSARHDRCRQGRARCPRQGLARGQHQLPGRDDVTLGRQRRDVLHRHAGHGPAGPQVMTAMPGSLIGMGGGMSLDAIDMTTCRPGQLVRCGPSRTTCPSRSPCPRRARRVRAIGNPRWPHNCRLDGRRDRDPLDRSDDRQPAQRPRRCTGSPPLSEADPGCPQADRRGRLARRRRRGRDQGRARRTAAGSWSRRPIAPRRPPRRP